MKTEPVRRVAELEISNTAVSFGLFDLPRGRSRGWHWADPFRPGTWHGPFDSLFDALEAARKASRTWVGRGN